MSGSDRADGNAALARHRENGRTRPRDHRAPAVRPVSLGDANRWFWPILLGICAFSLLVNALILHQGWKHNPFAASPCNDADVYWTWAKEISTGCIIGHEPFFSAPLYPYILGLIRAAGGGLTAVYCVQLFAHLSTVLLIGTIGARRFGPGVGLLAALLFVLLTEPTFYVGRALNCTIQVLLVGVLWAALIAAQQRPGFKRWAAVGITAGLNCLANPMMLVIVPVLAVWIHLQGPSRRRGLMHAALAVGATLVAISPATMHNYLASGEFIPISAQGGFTFYHGNNPLASGTASSVPGISASRRLQHLDAARIYEKASGRAGTWREVDGYFLRKGLAFWSHDPARAAGLVARKAYWFLTGRNYGDIYLPSLEVEAGLAGALRLAPLPLAWLMPPAILAAVVLVRRPNRYAPELLLLAIPLLAVLLFLYNPRYRFPAAPVIVVLAAWALRGAVRWRTQPRWTAAVGGTLAVALTLGAANRAVGFDAISPHRAGFHHSLGLVLDRTGKPEQAIIQYKQALKYNPDLVHAEAILGDALQRIGLSEEGLVHLRRAVQLDPRDAVCQNSLGIALVNAGFIDEAMSCFREAADLAPNLAACRNSLANALFYKGEMAEAERQYEAALQADPRMPEAHLNLGLLLARQKRDDAALHHFAEATRLDPHMAEAHYQTALLLLGNGQPKAAVQALQRAHACSPGQTTYAVALAWYLATGPDDVIDAGTAVALSRQANLQTGGEDPGVLDTLAAALAENGQFNEAVQTAGRARELATQQGNHPLAEAILARLTLYQHGQTCRGCAAPSLMTSR